MKDAGKGLLANRGHDTSTDTEHPAAQVGCTVKDAGLSPEVRLVSIAVPVLLGLAQTCTSTGSVQPTLKGRSDDQGLSDLSEKLLHTIW
jgi:hypothetical protein